MFFYLSKLIFLRLSSISQYDLKYCDKAPLKTIIKSKNLLNLYLRVICVVCCTHADVSIGRTGSPKEKHFKLITNKETVLSHKYLESCYLKLGYLEHPAISNSNPFPLPLFFSHLLSAISNSPVFCFSRVFRDSRIQLYSPFYYMQPFQPNNDPHQNILSLANLEKKGFDHKKLYLI